MLLLIYATVQGGEQITTKTRDLVQIVFCSSTTFVGLCNILSLCTVVEYFFIKVDYGNL